MTLDDTLNRVINQISDAAGEANDSMAGYYYQIDQTDGLDHHKKAMEYLLLLKQTREGEKS